RIVAGTRRGRAWPQTNCAPHMASASASTSAGSTISFARMVPPSWYGEWKVLRGQRQATLPALENLSGEPVRAGCDPAPVVREGVRGKRALTAHPAGGGSLAVQRQIFPLVRTPDFQGAEQAE